MATANKALKKRAQAFAAEHGLSYLKALHAVDEPLHELRDLIRSVKERSESTREHFRLIGDRGSLSSAYPIPQTESWARKIDIHGERVTSGIYRREIIQSEGLSALSNSEFFIELGRRTELLRRSGSDSIWDYRELHRSGLLDSSYPQLEPLFHHYTMDIPDGFGALIWSGPRLGLFGVNMDAFVEITVYDHIPVTTEQLRSLQSGKSPESPIELPLAHLPTEQNRRLRWTDSYVGAYRYFDEHGAGSVGPGLYLLLRSPIADLAAELANRGVDFSRFVEIEDFPLGVELSHSLLRDSLLISLPQRETAQRIATQGFLVLG